MIKRRKGLPKDLEDEIAAAIEPILEKYRDMKKSHMGSMMIRALANFGLDKACRNVFLHKQKEK